MSALVITSRRIACDGPKFGLDCDRVSPPTEDTLIALRALMVRNGWERRHHGDVQVDLCWDCARRAVLAPHRCGRPRLVR